MAIETEQPDVRVQRIAPSRGIARWTWRAAQAWTIAADRLRAVWWRSVRGARIGAKCRVGARSQIGRPWNVTFGLRVTLEPDVWLKLESEGARVSVGAFSFLGRGVEIDVIECVTIGRDVLIAPGVFITDHNHAIAAGGPIREQGCTAQSVTIEDDVWLGAKCVILPGVTIGRGAVVGAGAVVVHDVPEYAVVAGVPARVIRHRRERQQGPGTSLLV